MARSLLESVAPFGEAVRPAGQRAVGWLGAAGPHTRAAHAELMRTKFLTHGGPVEVAGTFASLSTCSTEELSRLLTLALAD